MATTTFTFDIERIKQSIYAHDALHHLLYTTGAGERPHILHRDHSAMLTLLIADALRALAARLSAYIVQLDDTIATDGLLRLTITVPATAGPLWPIFANLETAATHHVLEQAYRSVEALAGIADDHRAKRRKALTDLLALLARTEQAQ